MTTLYFDPRCKKEELAQQRVMLYHALRGDREGFIEISRELGFNNNVRGFYARGDLIILNQAKPSVIISETPQVAKAMLSDLEELAEIKLKAVTLIS